MFGPPGKAQEWRSLFFCKFEEFDFSRVLCPWTFVMGTFLVCLKRFHYFFLSWVTGQATLLETVGAKCERKERKHSFCYSVYEL